MKLFYSPTSPYARKVLLAAHQLGLIDRIELIGSALSPIACDPQVAERNPLGKIPALVTDDGQALYDSRVIVEYLESLSEGTLLPAAPDPARWTALRHQALADGLQDAALLARYETFLRPEPLRRSTAPSMCWRPRSARSRPARLWARSPRPAPWATWTSASPTTIGGQGGRRFAPSTPATPAGPTWSRPIRPGPDEGLGLGGGRGP
jgi:glutathione S-transferase